MTNVSLKEKTTLKEFGFVHRGGHWWSRRRESVIINPCSYIFYENCIANGIVFADIGKLADFLKNRQ